MLWFMTILQNETVRNTASEGQYALIQQMSYCYTNWWKSSCWLWLTLSEYTLHFHWSLLGKRLHRNQSGNWTTDKWKLFYWKSLGPAIHVDFTLTHTVYLNVVRDHVHPFMEAEFPDSCGLFQQDEYALSQRHKKHNKFEVLTKFHSSQSNQISGQCGEQASPIHGGPTTYRTYRICC